MIIIFLEAIIIGHNHIFPNYLSSISTFLFKYFQIFELSHFSHKQWEGKKYFDRQNFRNLIDTFIMVEEMVCLDARHREI